MLDSLLSIVAPHPCFGCNKLAAVLCDSCKYNIVSEPFDGCVACGKPLVKDGRCLHHDLPYLRAWCVGERTDILRNSIDAYKFEHAYAGHKVLGSLLSERIGMLPSTTVIVPIPSISSHVRRRGYDHTLLLAKAVAKKQKLRVSQLLLRQENTQQRGNNKKVRMQQASRAYKVAGLLSPHTPYLVIDDVITTGATVRYAAQALKDMGAVDIWAAALAYQPLD